MKRDQLSVTPVHRLCERRIFKIVADRVEVLRKSLPFVGFICAGTLKLCGSVTTMAVGNDVLLHLFLTVPITFGGNSAYVTGMGRTYDVTRPRERIPLAC